VTASDVTGVGELSTRGHHVCLLESADVHQRSAVGIFQLHSTQQNELNLQRFEVVLPSVDNSRTSEDL